MGQAGDWCEEGSEVQTLELRQQALAYSGNWLVRSCGRQLSQLCSKMARRTTRETAGQSYSFCFKKQILSEAVFRRIKERLFENNHHGFTEGRSCLTRAVDDERSMDALYLDFCKVCDILLSTVR